MENKNEIIETVEDSKKQEQIQKELKKLKKYKWIISGVFVIFFTALLVADLFMSWGKLLFIFTSIIAWLTFVIFGENSKMKPVIIMDETRLQKRKVRFRVFLCSFAIALTVAIVLAIIMGNYSLQKDYSKLKTTIKANDTVSMLSLYKNDDLLDYDTAIANYEKHFMGTTNSNILQDGKFYSCDKYILNSTESKLIKIENGESTCLVNESVSFINVWENIVYYRLDSTKTCMSLIDNQSSVVIMDLHVGQLLVDNGKIYFINLDDNAHLYTFDIKDGEIEPILKTPVQYFTIIGNKLIIMTRANKFGIYDKNHGTYENGISSVKSFAFTDKLYLSDGKHIVSCTPNLRKENKVANGEGILIATLGNAFILQNNTSLVYVTNDIEYLVEKDVSLCKTIILNDDTLTYVIVRPSDDGYSEIKIDKPISEITQKSNIME